MNWTINPATDWIANLTEDLIKAGYAGNILTLQYRNKRLIATIEFFCTPEEYRALSKDSVVYGQIRTHINKGDPHVYQVFYSLTENEYKTDGIIHFKIK